MVGTPIISSPRIVPSGSTLSTLNDEAHRKSFDTVRTSKSPMVGRKVSSKRPSNLQIHSYDANSEEADRDDNVSYFDHSPGPSQFLANRQRPLSFYDMKEQQKQARPGGAMASQRNSWRGSGEMPYNYADIIGANRSGYAPPKLGRETHRQAGDSAPPPAATELYLGLPWTMWMNSEVKNMFVASVGEWVGTTM
jgi:aquaporin related protein